MSVTMGENAAQMLVILLPSVNPVGQDYNNLASDTSQLFYYYTVEALIVDSLKYRYLQDISLSPHMY